MKLTFTTADGQAVTAEADDAAIIVTEIKQGTDEFVMVRLHPGSLTVTGAEDASRTLRFDGPR